ncbi:glycosyltransferase family 4 protein [Litchfieldella rifensis]|uniref:Glycosyltransferase family 4 protein n=1 Tax=Litchfieldella rifensis TaxID=762643 RepID=A0ABV7LT79_9GAMM
MKAISVKNDSARRELGAAVKICLIGNLGGAGPGQNGQILRTRLVAAELQKRLGCDRVHCIDTHDFSTRPLAKLLDIQHGFRDSEQVIIMPAERGLTYLLPFYLYWRRRYSVSVHYLVVGGWLPEFIDRHPRLVRGLRKLDSLHVQSFRMVESLKSLGFDNLRWLPNFRDFPTQRPLSSGVGEPLRLVFLSRMIPEKGADLAIQAVDSLNASCKQIRCSLDLYGPLTDDDSDWLSGVLRGRGEAVAYRGALAPESVLETLSRYDALIFPTRYEGEGFPGVVVEAYAAGLPVIASDWQDNAEVVIDGITGLLFPWGDAQALKERLDWLIHNSETLLAMKAAAREAAASYHVDVVIPSLLASMAMNVTSSDSRAREVHQ